MYGSRHSPCDCPQRTGVSDRPLECPCLVPTPHPQSWDPQAGMLHPWLILMLLTMLVLLLLLFQPRHTWDAQEGVVGVPVPDQQLLVWRNHLEREIKTGLLGGAMNIHPCADPLGPTPFL